ncbi:helix-turn-helix domain-containing protein [Amycolatopsis rubida]|uniref:HTH cro/C1-type domain-containing protein n=1 Tax=Amycolatopsis rubida TaxID=112413 RepID=A0A1I5XB58_9PSEU|nr:hypothetical protein [Amycolatopsis rubida]SFQ29212.1 hypothetical protein SAMN05421854_110135 [Amycolatopsis rubida]
MTAGERSRLPRATLPQHGFSAPGTLALHDPPSPGAGEAADPAPPRLAPIGADAATNTRCASAGGEDDAVSLLGHRPGTLAVLAEDAELYNLVLGDELRKRRTGRKWTRKNMLDQPGVEVALQTLTSYEQGTRQATVHRLVELCAAMDVLPQDLLASVQLRILGREPGRLRVRLPVLAASDDPGLAPMARWAAAMLRHPGHPLEVDLEPVAIEPMAELCGLGPADLVARLSALDPRPAREKATAPDVAARPRALPDHDTVSITARRLGSRAALWRTDDADSALEQVAVHIRGGLHFIALVRSDANSGSEEKATVVAVRSAEVLILGSTSFAAQLRSDLARPDCPARLRLTPLSGPATPLDGLAPPLPTATRNALAEAGFTTLAELSSVGETRWNGVPGLGAARAKALASVLRENRRRRADS